MLRVAKKTYYFNKIRCFAGNKRQTWKLINNLTNKSKRENVTDYFTADDHKIICVSEHVVKKIE